MSKLRTIAAIKEQIGSIIGREIEKTRKEMEEFDHKIYDNISYYGFGGQHTRLTRAKERREDRLKELEALRDAQGCSVLLDDVTMYAYDCPRCLLKVLLSSGHGEKVYCPICEAPIYRSSKYETMKVARGSRRAVLEHGKEVLLDSDGRIKE